MQSEVREMRKRLEESRKREEHLESVVEGREHGSGQLKKVIHSMREALKASGEEVASLGGHVEELEDTRDELQHKLTTLMEQHQLQTDEQADTEDRLSSEKARLSGDRQQLDAEVRELRLANHELEERLKGVDEKFESRSTDLDQERRQHAQMQQSTHQMKAELAAAKADLQVAEQELEQQQQSATNLDRVMATFQTNRDADLKSATRQLKERVAELEIAEAETETTTAAAVQAAAEAARKEAAEQLSSMQQSVEGLNRRLEEAQSAAERSNSDMRQAVTRLKDGAGDDLVDRQLVTKLIVTYVDQTLHDARQKDRETLELMSRILGFTEEEKKRVGLIKSGGGLLSWLAGAPEVQMQDTDGKSFEDLLGDFVDASADLGANAPPSPIA
jgi:chromosome segregation ATPase